MTNHLSYAYECFDVSVLNGIAHIQLNRPTKANSLTRVFWSELPTVINALSRSGSVRVAIISAQGKIFCGGLDLKMIATAEEFRANTVLAREALHAKVLQMQDALNALEQARFPVIAAVQGACVGGGLDLIAACDLCVASTQASFRVEETNIGMMADLGVLQRLPHFLPSGIARYLALTGDTLSVTDAERFGLVSRVYPDADALIEGAFAIAQAISQKPPVVIHSIKQAMVYSRDHGVYDSLRHTALLQTALLSGEDIQRAIHARSTGELVSYADMALLSSEF